MMKGLCLSYTSNFYTYQRFGPIEEESMRMLKSSASRDSGADKNSALITNSKRANTRVKVESTNDDYIPPPALVLSYERYLDNPGEHQESKPDTNVLIKREGEQLGLASSLSVGFLRELLRSKMIISHRRNCKLPLQNSEPRTI
jgi:hypothetical protein